MAEIVTVFVWGGALCMPLVYALMTLAGMKRKSVYPLLRIKGRSGDASLIKVPDA